MLNNRNLKKRSDIIILCLAVWALMCLAMFFYYSVIAKEKYIKIGNQIARRELVYYPERSKILDKNAVVLAWSEKHFDLYYNNLTDSPKQIKIIYERIKNIFPNAQKPSPRSLHSIMVRDLQPKQIIALEKSIYLYQELHISSRIERKVVDYPKVQALIGKAKMINGQLTGITGMEKLYNHTLSGTHGRFKIMLDRNKNWIKNSYKSIKLATLGKKVRLKLSIEEIRRGQK